MLGRKKKLGIALTCADWRLHQPRVDLNRRIGKALKVGGVDLIAVPGPDGLLIPAREIEWKSAVRQTAILAGAHSPHAIAVVAGQRSIGHNVSDEEHDADVTTVAKALKEALNFAGPVAAMVAVYHSDSRWDLKHIAEF